MSQLTKQIKLIERLDQLLRFENTGNPKELSNRLGISEAKLYRLINIMKDLNAPISYSFEKKSYIYNEYTSFKFGFYTQDLSDEKAKSIYGGATNFRNFLTLIKTFLR